MNIDELKKVVTENGYKLAYTALALYIYGYSHGFTDESKTEIWISKLKAKDVMILSGVHCEEKDFEVIKSCMRFAEIPIEDRGY